MYTRIGGIRTNAPFWVKGGRAWEGEEVVRDEEIPVESGLGLRRGLGPDGRDGRDGKPEAEGRLLHSDMRSFMDTQQVGDAEVYGEAPMFRITRYMHHSHPLGTAMSNAEPTDRSVPRCGEAKEEDEDQGQQAGEAYIAIAINHLVADGVGASRIARAILADDCDIGHLVPDAGSGHPPRLEHTVDLSAPLPAEPIAVTPSLPTTTAAAAPAEEEVASAGPAMTTRNTVWPGTAVAGPTINCPQGLSLLFLSPILVDKVKEAARARGIDKLHAALKTAWAVAMASVLGQRKRNHTQAEKERGGRRTESDHGYEQDVDWNWAISTPRNERRRGVHPYATGDYVSRIIAQFSSAQLDIVQKDLQARPAAATNGVTQAPNVSTSDPDTETEAFWDLARLVSAQLSDPTEQQAGRHAMSLPSLLPNPPTASSSGSRTAWEEHYLAQSRSPAPLPTSAILSNLTYIPLPPRATRMSWAQPACPFSAGIMTSIVGSEAGVSWASTWREGCAVREGEVRGVERAFVRVLEQVGA